MILEVCVPVSTVKTNKIYYARIGEKKFPMLSVDVDSYLVGGKLKVALILM